jgi:transcriptional regulator with XRE-family HTH domain
MAQTRLKQLREEAVLTVHELGEASGVSDDTISKIENGQRVARPSTLRKLAGALDVSPQELRRPAKVEEPAPLPKAPREAGQLAEEPEEEHHIPSIHPSALEEHIKLIKRLKEQREAEIEEVKQGAMPRVLWDFHLEADNEYLKTIHQAAGISDFVEEVTAGRRMTEWSVQRLCHEFSRHLSDFLKLADEAKALDHERQSDTYVEAVKGTSAVERYLQDEAQKQRSPES